MHSLGEGQMAVGHVRYSTTGGKSRNNIQPLVIRHVKGNLALVHNGNLTNAFDLRRSFELSGAIFHGTSDTEAITYEIVRHRLTSGSTEEAIEKAIPCLTGAYSCIVMTAQKLIAFRDPNGFRPLCIGQTKNGAYVLASESCALDAVGAVFLREVEPGEIVTVSSEGLRSVRTHCGKAPASICIFEYIYFARPDSVIDGVSVHHARMCAGRLLARSAPADADIVIGVPDSGLDAALGYAQESNIPYGLGFIKNKYIGRSFIQPEQSMRENAVRIKLNVIRESVAGKRVVMIDDSIVRGTTSAKIIRLLRDAGAREVHVRISSPPFLHGCYFGTDIDSEEHLIANQYQSVAEIAEHIGADSLAFLPVDSLGELIGQPDGFCMGCFTGDYPVDVSGAGRKNKFDEKL
ncbi:MAG: amidophosphoribosyltransferase [Oscillospiraceae bacterium]|nr:amidophosphoribosyltransferase [Oscillospiraceae bacterium]